MGPYNNPESHTFRSAFPRRPTQPPPSHGSTSPLKVPLDGPDTIVDRVTRRPERDPYSTQGGLFRPRRPRVLAPRRSYDPRVFGLSPSPGPRGMTDRSLRSRGPRGTTFRVQGPDHRCTIPTPNGRGDEPGRCDQGNRRHSKLPKPDGPSTDGVYPSKVDTTGQRDR